MANFLVGDIFPIKNLIMKNGRQPKSRLGNAQLGCKLQFEIILQGWRCGVRGVVVRERGGTPFRQIFWSRNSAPANIVGHRWNTNTEAFQQITSN